MPKRGVDFLRNVEKGPLLPVYCLYGEERLLIEKALSALETRVMEPSLREFNFSVLHGGESKPGPVMEAAATLPAFSEWRMVIVKEADRFSAPQLKEFLSYLESPSETTLLVFTASKVDLRKSFFSTIDKQGGMVNFSSLKRGELSHWLSREAKERGKSISPDAAGCLIEMVGNDLLDLSQEIEKLSLYIGERPGIELGDVEMCCADIRIDSIFEFTDAVGEGDVGKAFRGLSKLLTSGEASPKILTMLERHFRLLWRVKVLTKQRVERKDMGREIGIHPMVLGKYEEQARRLTERDLKEIFERLYHADKLLKRSKVPVKLVLEEFCMDAGLKRWEANSAKRI